MNKVKEVLALDIGEKRIGVALADIAIKIPIPQAALEVDDETFEKIKRLISDNNIDILIVGMPRNQSGEKTNQSQKIEDFISQLGPLNIDVIYQDESLTSVQARENLGNKYINKGEIDSEAACLILEDYLNNL